MTRPNENPLIPESLAADGMQGASAEAGAPCEQQDTEIAPPWRWLARTGVALAAWALDQYALITDTPERGSVEAANCIDAAAEYLSARCESSAANKEVDAGAEA